MQVQHMCCLSSSQNQAFLFDMCNRTCMHWHTHKTNCACYLSHVQKVIFMSPWYPCLWGETNNWTYFVEVRRSQELCMHHGQIFFKIYPAHFRLTENQGIFFLLSSDFLKEREALKAAKHSKLVHISLRKIHHLNNHSWLKASDAKKKSI